TDFGANHPVFKMLNENAYHNSKVSVLNMDAFIALENDTTYYDVIIIDFPDPRSIELARLYTKEMYHYCRNRLRLNGIIITQATSPYFQTRAYYCINKTMQSAGFSTLPIHNHVQSFGEWGWIVGSKLLDENIMKSRLRTMALPELKTRWLNEDALKMMTLSGKVVGDTVGIEVNTLHNPVLYQYYIRGTEFNQAFYD
ncbi:MAG: spermidine synthase, partial [Crocinitomicaceae bacterium]|nr:spermidine synthase [Crocinitomicaceae bacterium]